LHVLGTPPAFVLSQDQTLRRKNSSSPVAFREGPRLPRCTLARPKPRSSHASPSMHGESGAETASERVLRRYREIDPWTLTDPLLRASHVLSGFLFCRPGPARSYSCELLAVIPQAGAGASPRLSTPPRVLPPPKHSLRMPRARPLSAGALAFGTLSRFQRANLDEVFVWSRLDACRLRSAQLWSPKSLICAVTQRATRRRKEVSCSFFRDPIA
jgi:hypothetical protein